MGTRFACSQPRPEGGTRNPAPALHRVVFVLRAEPLHCTYLSRVVWRLAADCGWSSSRRSWTSCSRRTTTDDVTSLPGDVGALRWCHLTIEKARPSIDGGGDVVVGTGWDLGSSVYQTGEERPQRYLLGSSAGAGRRHNPRPVSGCLPHLVLPGTNLPKRLAVGSDVLHRRP